VSGDATFSTNVGIGISPLSRLHISGAGDQSIILQSTSTGTTTSSYIKYIRATTGSARTWWTGVGIQGGTDDSYSFYDQTAGSERLRITSGGNVGIGTSSPSASAILQADSTTRGFLPPRMTNAQRTAISSPAVGLMVYQTDSTEGTYEYISSGWRIINGGGGGGVDELQVALLSQVYG